MARNLSGAQADVEKAPRIHLDCGGCGALLMVTGPSVASDPGGVQLPPQPTNDLLAMISLSASQLAAETTLVTPPSRPLHPLGIEMARAAVSGRATQPVADGAEQMVVGEVEDIGLMLALRAADGGHELASATF